MLRPSLATLQHHAILVLPTKAKKYKRINRKEPVS